MKMKKILKKGLLVAALLVYGAAVAGPQDDLQRYQEFFKKRFPDMSFADLSYGMYLFNEDKRSQYNDIMEFPPYEVAIEEGKELFSKPFANGKTYADCLPNGGIGIAQLYPKFDKQSGKVKTLAGVINECREQNGEKPLNVLKGDLAKVIAYMADTSRGKSITIEVPDDPRALAAYEHGKQNYFTRRGPREFACYHCHWEASGQRIRGNELSPAIGQAANFPVYRSKWGEIGTIQRRYIGCMRNIGAVPLKEQSEAMNNLEYFHTFLSNGVPYNAPNSRF
ncbi:sulfur oxidation c-type cytochrome SoxA [Kaarinaea lacus]